MKSHRRAYSLEQQLQSFAFKREVFFLRPCVDHVWERREGVGAHFSLPFSSLSHLSPPPFVRPLPPSLVVSLPAIKWKGIRQSLHVANLTL